MTRRPRNKSPLATTRFVLATGLLTLTGTAGCQTIGGQILTGVVQAALDDDVGPASRGPLPSASAGLGVADASRVGVASVYEVGPTPGWRSNLGRAYSFSTGLYYQSSFFQGQCPSLFHVSLNRSNDPFGPLPKHPSTVFSLGNTLNIHANYVPLGHVVPVGAPPSPEHAWQQLNMYGQGGDGCGFPGLRLLTFGSDPHANVVLR